MLSPYTVLDLSDEKGELASMVLGDMGADIIKVEPPGGSPSRSMGPFLDDAPGVDYFATPATDLKKVLFADPDSALASATMPEAQTDEERGMQAIDRVRSLSTIAKFLWPLPDHGLIRRMVRIKCPTLVIVGENDQIVPASYADEFTDRIHGSKQHMMAGAGHMFILEQPDAFANVVTDFLNS